MKLKLWTEDEPNFSWTNVELDTYNRVFAVIILRTDKKVLPIYRKLIFVQALYIS